MKELFAEINTLAGNVNHTLRKKMNTLCEYETYLYAKGRTRLWGDPSKWMRHDVTPRKFRSESVLESYCFPSPKLLCNIK